MLISLTLAALAQPPGADLDLAASALATELAKRMVEGRFSRSGDPTDEEVVWSRRIWELSREPCEAGDQGACQLAGRVRYVCLKHDFDWCKRREPVPKLPTDEVLSVLPWADPPLSRSSTPMPLGEGWVFTSRSGPPKAAYVWQGAWRSPVPGASVAVPAGESLLFLPPGKLRVSRNSASAQRYDRVVSMSTAGFHEIDLHLAGDQVLCSRVAREGVVYSEVGSSCEKVTGVVVFDLHTNSQRYVQAPTANDREHLQMGSISGRFHAYATRERLLFRDLDANTERAFPLAERSKGVVVHSSGRVLVVGESSTTLYSFSNPEPLVTVPSVSGTRAQFLKDGSFVLVGQAVRLFTADGGQKQRFRLESGQPMFASVVHPNGRSLVYDGALYRLQEGSIPQGMPQSLLEQWHNLPAAQPRHPLVRYTVVFEGKPVQGVLVEGHHTDAQGQVSLPEDRYRQATPLFIDGVERRATLDRSKNVLELWPKRSFTPPPHGVVSAIGSQSPLRPRILWDGLGRLQVLGEEDLDIYAFPKDWTKLGSQEVWRLSTADPLGAWAEVSQRTIQVTDRDGEPLLGLNFVVSGPLDYLATSNSEGLVKVMPADVAVRSDSIGLEPVITTEDGVERWRFPLSFPEIGEPLPALAGWWKNGPQSRLFLPIHWVEPFSGWRTSTETERLIVTKGRVLAAGLWPQLWEPTPKVKSKNNKRWFTGNYLRVDGEEVTVHTENTFVEGGALTEHFVVKKQGKRVIQTRHLYKEVPPSRGLQVLHPHPVELVTEAGWLAATVPEVVQVPGFPEPVELAWLEEGGLLNGMQLRLGERRSVLLEKGGFTVHFDLQYQGREPCESTSKEMCARVLISERLDREPVRELNLLIDPKSLRPYSLSRIDRVTSENLTWSWR